MIDESIYQFKILKEIGIRGTILNNRRVLSVRRDSFGVSHGDLGRVGNFVMVLGAAAEPQLAEKEERKRGKRERRMKGKGTVRKVKEERKRGKTGRKEIRDEE